MIASLTASQNWRKLIIRRVSLPPSLPFRALDFSSTRLFPVGGFPLTAAKQTFLSFLSVSRFLHFCFSLPMNSSITSAQRLLCKLKDLRGALGDYDCIIKSSCLVVIWTVLYSSEYSNVLDGAKKKAWTPRKAKQQRETAKKKIEQESSSSSSSSPRSVQIPKGLFRVSSLVCRERKNAVGFLPELNGI